MTTWADFLTQVRRTVLKDVTTVPQITDARILDSYNWAQDTFVEHTALASVATTTSETGPEIDVPSNVYESLEASGILTFIDGSGNVKTINPIRKTEGLSPADAYGFSVWGDKIILTTNIPAGSILKIRYYAYYPRIAIGTDVLSIPQWSENALAMLTGAYALVGDASASARIDRWKDNEDKGQPENNALRVQSAWMVKQYDIMIGRHPRQSRENMFRGTFG